MQSDLALHSAILYHHFLSTEPHPVLFIELESIRVGHSNPGGQELAHDNTSPNFNPFSKRQILDSSNFKEFADDNFKFDETGRKFSERIENTVEMGEIARHEQFLLFPQ